MMFYVYVYHDPITFEPFYVGKGSGDRARKHLSRKDKHPFVQKIQKLLKEGNEPIIHKIDCPSEDEAFRLEIAMIKFIGRDDLKTGPLLNLTAGGENPPNHKGKPIGLGNKESEETKRRKSESQKAIGNKPPTQYGDDNIARKPEERERRRQLRLGKKMPQISVALLGKKRQKQACHCGKFVSKSGFGSKYHFDNCQAQRL